MPFLREAQRAGCQLVVIDPRRTRTAAGADWHLAPRPGTDGALALGLAHIIVNEGLHDEAWLAAHTVGWPELRAAAGRLPAGARGGDHRLAGSGLSSGWRACTPRRSRR